MIIPPTPYFLASKKRWHIGFPSWGTGSNIRMATPGMPIRSEAHTIRFIDALAHVAIPKDKAMAIFRTSIEGMPLKRLNEMQVDWRRLAILIKKEIQISHVSDSNPLIWKPLAIYYPDNTFEEARNNQWSKRKPYG